MHTLRRCRNKAFGQTSQENGAEKSTLIKCLTGVNKFEAGEINLCPNLSVADILHIGRDPLTKLRTVDRKKGAPRPPPGGFLFCVRSSRLRSIQVILV